MGETYYIRINGENVPVSEEVYRAYRQPVWRETKRSEVRSDHEYSYERMLEDGMEIASRETLVENIVEDKLMLDMLLAALNELTADERNLIDALFYQGKSEREVAGEIGISSIAVHKRKHKILSKLRKLLKI